MNLYLKAIASTMLVTLSIHGQSNPPQGGNVPPTGGQGNATQGNQGAGNAQGLNQSGQNQPNRTNPAMFGRVNQNGWFMDQHFQSQLRISPEQAKLLNQQYSTHYDTYNNGQSRFSGSNLTAEQRAEQMQSTNRFYNDFSKSANGVFDANQRTRFNQLSLQYRGYQAFNDPQIAQRLQLTKDQLDQLRTYEQAYDQQLTNTYKFRSTDPKVFPTRFGELRKDMYGRINTVLTPEQQRAWKELVGDPYDFRVE